MISHSIPGTWRHVTLIKSHLDSVCLYLFSKLGLVSYARLPPL